MPRGSSVRKDQIVFFHGQATADREHFFRIVEVWDEEKQRSFTFLTNHLAFAATTIAAIYKDRWKVELFFEAIKQNLKIKTFLGTNANAVKTQIWTAPIAMLVLRYLQLMSTFAWSLSNLAALLRHQLFVYRDLFAWLNAPFEGPPQLADTAKGQLNLGIQKIPFFEFSRHSACRQETINRRSCEEIVRFTNQFHSELKQTSLIGARGEQRVLFLPETDLAAICPAIFGAKRPNPS